MFAEEGSDYNVTSAFASSQSMSDMKHVSTLLQDILEWKWKRAKNDRNARRSDLGAAVPLPTHI